MTAHHHLSTAPRAQRWRTHLASITVVLLVGATAACAVPPPTAPDPYGLRAALGDGAIELTWNAMAAVTSSGYEVQVATPGGWSTWVTTPETSATFTEVVPRTAYDFRLRTAAGDGNPAGAWSAGVESYYVEPVLPVVRIDTLGAAPILDRENYVPGTIQIDPNGSAFAAYSGTMGIRGRGNSTWNLPKKPYKVKLDTASPIMGIAAERDWALLANYLDPSQLRTVAAMEASRATDLPFTSTLRHVEVILNGRYDGVYVLTEHMEVGPARVNITGMKSTDISGNELTGGYRLEVDSRLEENNEPGFRTTRDLPIVIKDPDPATVEQRVYIRRYVQSFEDALFAPNYTDPVNGYRRYLDTHSFIDHYLVNELTRSQDHFYASTFFTKNRGDDLLRFGPVWDFDISMGSLHGNGGLTPEGWYARTRRAWNLRIFSDPTFLAELEVRWNQLRPQFESIAQDLEAQGAPLAPAIDNDGARWGYTLDTTDTPQFLSAWLSARIAWMDAEFDRT